VVTCSAVFHNTYLLGARGNGTGNSRHGLTAVGATNVTYDDNYNLTYEGLHTLTYDVEDRVIQAENATWCPIGIPCAYAYDPLGQGKKKTVNILLSLK
jgi:hypothetical protein